MSVPKVDPNFTLDDLRKVAAVFTEAGFAYWEAAHKAGMHGAIMWVTSEDGAMVLYTRGEYQQQILNNIARTGPTTSFGAMKADE